MTNFNNVHVLFFFEMFADFHVFLGMDVSLTMVYSQLLLSLQWKGTYKQGTLTYK